MTDEPNADRADDGEVPDGVTLRITVEGADEFHDHVERRLAELDADGPGPGEHVKAFETVAQLRRILTDRRVELLETLLREDPGSITALAERVGRATGDVHDDLHVLADEGIVVFERDGRRMRPTIPYETVRIDFTLPRHPTDSGDAGQPA